MSPSVFSGKTVDPLLAELIEEITDKLQAGAKVDLDRYLQQHPDWAEELRALLPALCMLAVAGSSTGNSEPAPVAAGALPGDLGDFRIIQEIGRGGMGIVYEAEQLTLGRRVAVKVLPFAATLDPKQIQRFKNEAQAAGQLHHTNIVPVHFVGCERGVHFFAMQFIAGQSLAGIITDMRKTAAQANPKPLEPEALATVAAELSPVANTPGPEAASPFTVTPPVAALSTERSVRSPHYFRTVARLGIQAAQDLEHAHDLGVVHRDIKPGNLLLDHRGNLWVTDFGLAQIRGDNQLTLTGDLLGTLRYMSPEQALAQRVGVDHRTDIYSLGATLYELLTLEPVLAGADRQELLRQIAFEEPKALRRHNKSIPAELEIIVLKALEKNPADRYATAKALAEDLERFVKDEPIRARRPSLTRRLRSWCRRHKAVVAGTIAIMATALLLSRVNIWWQAHRLAAKEQATSYYVRACTLHAQEKHAEAEVAIRKSIELNPDFFDAYVTLGNVLGAQGRNQEALTMQALTPKVMELIKLDPGAAVTWAFNRGNGLLFERKWSEAAASYRQAIKVQPSAFRAYQNLSDVLEIQGDFAASLGPRAPARLVKRRQWLVMLEAKLPTVLNGDILPTDAAERIGLAFVCQVENKQLYRASARLYMEAFAAKPDLVEDNCWAAAGAAAQAGCGRGKDAANLEPKEYARLRGQALAWLQGRLDTIRVKLDAVYPHVCAGVREELQYFWQKTPVLSGVRDAEALAKLPEIERRAWQKLWEDVAELRKRAAQPQPR